MIRAIGSVGLRCAKASGFIVIFHAAWLSVTLHSTDKYSWLGDMP